MKERFKRYLEQQFRAIRPTLAAAEYREKMLKQLMDRAQELRIKGMDDEDLIYDICIEELGDFGATLAAFDEQEHKVANTKRNAVLGAVCGVGAALALVIVYLIVSLLVPNSWGLTWLILVGGAFAAVIAVAVVLLVKFGKAKKYIAMRLMPPVVIVLLCVYLFLLLQLVGAVPMAWLVFLAMVIMIAAFDGVLAFITEFKFRWIELPIVIEIVCVMVYVIVGIVVPSGFWHPGWLLCLGGVVAAIAEAIVLIATRNVKKDKKEKVRITDKYTKEDESYYTSWKD